MPEQIAHNQNDYKLRAKLPQYIRVTAIAAIAVSIFVVVVGFYRERSRSSFKLKSEHTQLSTDVTADVNGYERLETDEGVSKYYIKAESARTFSDNHQELQNVYIETFDKDGAVANKMTAESALYVPEQDKNFTAYLKGKVEIETAEAVKIKTDNVVYTKSNDTAEADEAVEFQHDNIRGKAVGATVRLGEKVVELLKDVEIEAFESPELARANIRYAKINAGSASYDQGGHRIDLHDSVSINIESKSGTGKLQTTTVNAARGTVMMGAVDAKPSNVKRFELFDNVHIVSVESGASPTTIDTQYALYDKDADRFELRKGVQIVTAANDKPTSITAIEAIYEQSAGKMTLTSAAQITHGPDYIKGDLLYADLYPDKNVKNAIARGNAAARQTAAERTTNIAAPELNATFSESHQMKDANAIGQSNVEIIPKSEKDYSRLTLSAKSGIGLLFKGDGMIDTLRTDGRTEIQLNAPNAPGASNKRLAADVVRTIFSTNGKDISRAEAVGNAELYIDPLQADRKNFKTTVLAPRFDCDFFQTGNNVKTCIGRRKTKTVRTPTVDEPGHGTQTLTADQLRVDFSETSKGIEQMKASGNARFNESDHNGVAAEITYTEADETVRLRGGEPTGWDSKYRAKAGEIDWDTRNQHTYLKGKVSTTYYSLKQMANSAPFGDSEKPVFITSDRAEFDQPTETAVYTGNARGWQENNYVHGDKFTLLQNDGRFIAEGHIKSTAYNVKTNKKSGNDGSIPVFASADSMTYLRDSRVLQYRINVDIRQGTDRIVANSADVYLNEQNAVSKTIAERDIVITQPGRRGTGDWLQYSADDEMAVLRGNPATIEDAENGRSQAAQLTFYMKDKRILGEGKTKQSTVTRTKSVYKVQGKQ